jgi:hypothetical protein
MEAFRAVRCESVEYSPLKLGRAGGHGFRAPGHMIMVVRDGSGWVMNQDGVPEPVDAVTVVAWDAGDWVAYGSDGSGEFKADLYWATDMTEDQRGGDLSGVFGHRSN